MDDQVGRVLAALAASGLEKNTIVVLWSDHGWHLGEKGITGKNTLWERSTRVPLIFAGPAVAGGAKCDRCVELLDLYPTLCSATGIMAPAGLEGRDLGPLLRESKAVWPHPAVTTHNRGNHSVRSERFRYIRYADGSEELYDRAADPDEWTNFAGSPEFAATKAELAKHLPKTDVAAALGSQHRLLEVRGDGVYWEGKRIDPAATLPDDE